jgi:hypothetical protein
MEVADNGKHTSLLSSVLFAILKWYRLSIGGIQFRVKLFGVFEMKQDK